MSEIEDPQRNGNRMGTVPGLARIALSAWLRTAEWTLGTSVRVGARVFDAARSGDAPTELFSESAADLRKYARGVLGIADPEPPPVEEQAKEEEDPELPLRERGAELLRRSADVHAEEDAHPAYERILEQLAPDEGRILRLLALKGPQPSVDVRTGWLPVDTASELIAPGLTMIGAEAGCRRQGRVHAYLNNLERLGLIWFSREPIKEQSRYQVLEAQPEVAEALDSESRTRTVRRSIHLTPFGEDFCETCLPIHTEELEALPGPNDPADD
jgi:Abortive infection alpha